MKKHKIKGTKALNKATTLIPPKGKKWKGEFDDGGYMDRQSSSRQQAQQGVGAIPVWGQLAGATMSISDGIRGGQEDPTANAIANVISPSSGIRNAYESGHSEDMLVAAFNPIGGGVLAAQRTEEDAAKRQKQLDAVTTRRLIDNSGSAFAKGGKLSSYLKVQNGGYLKPISEDAVQVVGNNPSITDGVELENAFVDNNEVIDRENRVFSDVIVGPTGRSVASEAKRLEKMKSSSSRFKMSNERIDAKVDDLFNFQEQIKRMSPPVERSVPESTFKSKYSYEKLPTTIEGWKEFNAHKQEDIEAKQNLYMNTPGRQTDLRNAVKHKDSRYLGVGKFAKGGKLNTNNNVYKYNATDFSSQEGQMNFDINSFNQTSQGSTSAPSLDWQQIGTTAAAFAPNIVNAFQTKRLKGPANPTLENRVSLQRLNADDQLVAAGNQARLAQQVIQRNTAQGSNLVAGTGSLLAKRLANQNEIYGNVNRQNAAIAAQEAGMNMMVGARNANRLSDYNQAQNDFYNTKRRLESENIANASNKLQVMGRERNQMKRDQQDFQLTQAAYGDSGVLARLWQQNPELAASIEESMGKRSGTLTKSKIKMGGKLYRKAC